MRCCPFYVAIIAIALPVGSALAQDTVAQFYRSRQITVIVGSSAGGGYDIYARLLAHHVPKHIPGNPSVVVVNMPGAGSNTAAAYLFNVAPNDGTYIGALQNSVVMDALFDTLLGNARRLRHDATKFIHLGSATIDHYVCIARSDAPVKTFRDTLTREFLIGASQPGTSTRDYPAMLNNTTGAKIRQVSGYPGTREITLAIEKNEVQGLCGFSWSSLQAQRPDWIKSGLIRVIVPADEGLGADDRDGLQDRRKPSIQLDQEQAIPIREVNTTTHLPPQYDQLMSERDIFCLKPALRLERRCEQRQKKAEQSDHRRRS
jgi:tripartite-type tricarboxylate transporter receptor subunit TctC